MTNLHKDFPNSIGFWIWEIPALLGQYGTLDAVAQHCRDNNIGHVIVKAGDGESTWDSITYLGKTYPQFTPEMVQTFKNFGIKVYGWAFNYGNNPDREADIAIWALGMGIDGFVFNAESAYQGKHQQAVQMLERVRAKYPTAFLAHAPFPYISYHTSFPYMEFGKYCDAVMPQMYWGTIGTTVSNCINKTFQDWTAWEKQMRETGHEDSIKPIIPLGQFYDNPQVGYVETSKDIEDFISQLAGYYSVNFWSFQALTRPDCWDAIKRSQVKKIVVEVPPVVTSPAEPPVVPIEEKPPVIVQDPVTATPPISSPPVSIPCEGTSQEGMKHIDYFIEFIHVIIKILNYRIL